MKKAGIIDENFSGITQINLNYIFILFITDVEHNAHAHYISCMFLHSSILTLSVTN